MSMLTSVRTKGVVAGVRVWPGSSEVKVGWQGRWRGRVRGRREGLGVLGEDASV